MQLLVVLLSFIAVGSILATHDNNGLTFETWKLTHGKTYSSNEEELLRQEIWNQNLKDIDTFNLLGNHSYTLAMNEFGDLTKEEFRAKYLSSFKADFSNDPILLQQQQQNEDEQMNYRSLGIPSSVDWRTKGAVTSVKNQGQCGSCYAFSAVGPLEGIHFLKYGKLFNLSAQNLVDCSSAEGNQGCNGGYMDASFNYIQKNKGIDTEESYPYKGEEGTCRFSTAHIAATCNGFRDLPRGNETAFTIAIAEVGPIASAMDATDFQFYSSGVYDPATCSSTNLDHTCTAVGYGTLSGKDYYIMKNSWGSNWGMNGYILMIRNKKNYCGIATMSSYPLV